MCNSNAFERPDFDIDPARVRYMHTHVALERDSDAGKFSVALLYIGDLLNDYDLSSAASAAISKNGRLRFPAAGNGKVNMWLSYGLGGFFGTIVRSEKENSRLQ